MNMQECKAMEDIQISIKEVDRIVKTLDLRKATGPDGVSGRLIKECRNQLLDK